MKVGIVGSRRLKNKQRVIQLVNSLSLSDIVVSGGCVGTDQWAVEVAKARGMRTEVFLPDLLGIKSEWDGVKRYYERNKRIAEACDVLYAFVSKDRTGGTENTIGYVKDMGKTVHIMEWTKDSDKDPISEIFLEDTLELLKWEGL